MTGSVTEAAFRDALSHFASGVTIVTADGASGRAGFTATGFSSLSLDPPLVLVCVSKTASAYDAVMAADHFAVNVLEEGQSWLAERFARSGIDRFDGIALRAGGHKAPLIAGALVHLECTQHERLEAGDHTILVGRVTSASTGEGRPLLHYNRQFGAFIRERSTEQ